MNRSRDVIILYDGGLYNLHRQDFDITELPIIGLWILVDMFYGRRFSRYEFRLCSDDRTVPEKILRFTIQFTWMAAKKNFFSFFAPELLQTAGPQNESPFRQTECVRKADGGELQREKEISQDKIDDLVKTATGDGHEVSTD